VIVLTEKIVAVVFDFDGLLADSEPLQIQAWRSFLARYDRVLDDALLDEMFGLRVKDSSRLVQERLNLPLTPDQVMSERDEIFLELVATTLPLMDGAYDVIDELRSLPGMRLALATSGHRRYISAALDVTGLENAFEVVVTGDDVERGKPDPEIYALAAQRLGVEPSTCLALEDAPHGIRSAKAAGMWCLAIPNEMTASIPGLDLADAVLSDLGQVIPWLRQNGFLTGSEDGDMVMVADGE
jgi:HAD superfamily hydrolase (TIGR01509 family)